MSEMTNRVGMSSAMARCSRHSATAWRSERAGPPSFQRFSSKGSYLVRFVSPQDKRVTPVRDEWIVP